MNNRLLGQVREHPGQLLPDDLAAGYRGRLYRISCLGARSRHVGQVMLHTGQKGACLTDPLRLRGDLVHRRLDTLLQGVQVGIRPELDTLLLQVLADANQLLVALQATTLQWLAAGAPERILNGAPIVAVVVLPQGNASWLTRHVQLGKEQLLEAQPSLCGLHHGWEKRSLIRELLFPPPHPVWTPGA